jgi:hypothetical protein
LKHDLIIFAVGAGFAEVVNFFYPAARFINAFRADMAGIHARLDNLFQEIVLKGKS